jgi:hypothetical protein
LKLEKRQVLKEFTEEEIKTMVTKNTKILKQQTTIMQNNERETLQEFRKLKADYEKKTVTRKAFKEQKNVLKKKIGQMTKKYEEKIKTLNNKVSVTQIKKTRTQRIEKIKTWRQERRREFKETWSTKQESTKKQIT